MKYVAVPLKQSELVLVRCRTCNKQCLLPRASKFPHDCVSCGSRLANPAGGNIRTDQGQKLTR